MREYTFLLKGSFRTEHVKANTLRQAWFPLKKKYKDRIIPIYQFANKNDYVMSGWLNSNDKKLIGAKL